MLSARAVEAPQAAAARAAAASLMSAVWSGRRDRLFIGRLPFSDDRGWSGMAPAVDSDGTVVSEQRLRLLGSIDLHRQVEASLSERTRQRQGGPVTVTR